MAARNPSYFDLSYDESSFLPKHPVTKTPADTVLNNQQFVLDHTNLIFSWVSGAPLMEDVGALSAPQRTGWRWWRKLWVHFDMCGVSASHNVYASFLAGYFDAAGPTVGDSSRVGLRFNNVAGGPNILYANVPLDADARWTSLVGPVAMRSDGEEEIDIGFLPDPQSNGPLTYFLFLWGISLYSAER